MSNKLLICFFVVIVVMCINFINVDETDFNILCGTKVVAATCEHNFISATCTTPSKCSKCGMKTGTPSGHPGFSPATCTSPSKCIRCGVSAGKALGHKYTAATCTSPKKCLRCGTTTGRTLSHKYILKLGMDYNETQHFDKSQCECGATKISNKKSHTYNNDNKCKVCGYIKPIDNNKQENASTTMKCSTNQINPEHAEKIEIRYTINSKKHVKNTYCPVCKVKVKIENQEHDYKTRKEIKYNTKYHWEIWECECSKTEIKNKVTHTLENDKCLCGYTFVCNHKGNKKTEKIYKSETEHIIRTYCSTCNETTKEKIQKHSGKFVERVELNNEMHTKKMLCSGCKKEYGVEEKHSFNNKGICKCGYDKNKQDIVKPPVQDEEINTNFVYTNYSPSDFSQSKPVMNKDSYTDADWTRMEAELKARVNVAGYGTRAGVVEAALYLASLDYAVPYRGTPMNTSKNIGVYPQLGLNRTWGSSVKLSKEVKANGKTYDKNTKVTNGMDCGAFLTWALVNGGVLPEGSTSYGPSKATNSFTNDTRSGLPQRMKSALGSQTRAHALADVANEVEPGDIALTYGNRNGKNAWTHVGLVVGVDKDNIYVAEENTTTYSPDRENRSITVNKLVVTRVPKTHTGNVLGFIVLTDNKLYPAKNADGTENKGNMPIVWGN